MGFFNFFFYETLIVVSNNNFIDHSSVVSEVIMTSLRKYIPFILFALLIFCNNATAINEIEQRELNSIISEITFIENIVFITKNSVSENQRIKFDYESLEEDLLKIKTGIIEHLKNIDRDPRRLPAVTGDYNHAD